MLKVFKNEMIKMISGKKLYIFSVILIASIIIMALLCKSIPSVKIGPQNFVAQMIMNGMIMEPLIPIFMILVAAEIITEDYSSGTMKFTLMTPIRKIDVFAGKLLFMGVYIVILMAICFVSSYIVQIFFCGLGGSSIFFKTFIYNLKCFVVVIPPLIAFSAIVGFISLFITSSGAVIGIGIGVYIIAKFLNMGIKNFIYFSPVGGFYASSFIGKTGTYGIWTFMLSSLVYIIVFAILIAAVVKKKDFVL